MKKSIQTAIAAVIVLSASAALAGPPAGPKCQASKGKVVGGYYACRQKAAATAAAKGGAADYSKCIAKFTERWDGAESAGGGMCPDHDVTTPGMESYLAGQATEAAAIVAGTQVIPGAPQCGDGAINSVGEHCDGAALDGHTCAAFGMYGTLACTPDCEFDLGGCTTCPASTISYADACWVLGPLSGSCDAACAAHGLVYDDATASVAGSEGTDASCVALLYVTGASGAELDNAGGNCTTGVGCAVLPSGGYRARCGTPATDATSTAANVQRVCACQ